MEQTSSSKSNSGALKALPLKSTLYVPANKERAHAKLTSLKCDCVIFDLEDSVLPNERASARETLRSYFKQNPHCAQTRVIRINGLDTPWGREDLVAACACCPDAILLPKVNQPSDILDLAHALDERDVDPLLKIWAMIETPRSIANIFAISDLGLNHASRLSCLVVGTNDLAKDTGVALTPTREFLFPWLMQIIVAARAAQIQVLDGVCNQFSDMEQFHSECEQSKAMGFDGKTLIHPAQIEPTNQIFMPSDEEIHLARLIVEGFSKPENQTKGVIVIEGKMVERLHLEQALQLLAKT